MRRIVKGLHNYSLAWANTKWGSLALFLCAFADSSFLPLPTIALFLSLIFLRPNRIFTFSFIGTVGSLIGALAGYSIGLFAWTNSNGEFTSVAQFAFDHIPGFTIETYLQIRALFTEWEFWILFIASLSPIPYKLFAIGSGVFGVPLYFFAISTLVGQSIKFFGIGILVHRYGTDFKRFARMNMKPLAYIIAIGIAIAIIFSIIWP
jgi:membrane protein YqaA with SNARE-associated domain